MAPVHLRVTCCTGTHWIVPGSFPCRDIEHAEVPLVMYATGIRLRHSSPPPGRVFSGKRYAPGRGKSADQGRHLARVDSYAIHERH